jgi:hypothetical protein
MFFFICFIIDLLFKGAPLPVYYAFRLSMGFGKILLEFNPVDIRDGDTSTPAVAAVEEQVLLVR